MQIVGRTLTEAEIIKILGKKFLHKIDLKKMKEYVEKGSDLLENDMLILLNDYKKFMENNC